MRTARSGRRAPMRQGFYLTFSEGLNGMEDQETALNIWVA